MQVSLEIPDYLSLKHWKQFVASEHLEPTEKMISMISLLSDKSEDEVKAYTPVALKSVYEAVLKSLNELEPSFYPVFELDGVLYGFRSMTSLTLGEYVDLERLAKQPQENIEEIMAILYRPITKERFSGIKWAFKNRHKIALGEAENLFKYYEVEEYDSSMREANAKKLSVIPASMALGALSFFLVVGTTLSLGSSLSSLDGAEAMKTMKEMNKQMSSLNIGDGCRQFITSLKHPSFQSQAINQYQS